jgi:hypothetical protein
MLNLESRDYWPKRPDLNCTVWHCYRCGSFVSVHSNKVVNEALCPLCFDIELEFCGSFASIIGQPFADA